MTALTELEQVVVDNWLKTGAIHVTEYGHENTYYINEFNHRFFCKNNPECRWGETVAPYSFA